MLVILGISGSKTQIFGGFIVSHTINKREPQIEFATMSFPCDSNAPTVKWLLVGCNLQPHH